MDGKPPSANGVASSGNWTLAEYAMSFVSGARNDAAAAASQVARGYAFRCGGKCFLLPQGTLAELISYPNYTPLPNSPEHCLGLANVRGNIIPFYSMRPLMEAASQRTQIAGQYGLMVGEANQAVLLAIDEKPTPIPLSELTELSYSLTDMAFSVAIPKIYQHAGELWYLLNYRKLFDFLSSYDTEVVSVR